MQITQTGGARPPTSENPARQALRVAFGDSELGPFCLAVSRCGIAALLLGESGQALRRELHRRFAATELRDDQVGLRALAAQVRALIAAPGDGHDLPVDPAGTAFQTKVWAALRDIPAGTTRSYADIARRIGAPAAARAVARACAANPVAIAIPCHRVVRGDGSLGGYRWGVERKALLLRAEAAL